MCSKGDRVLILGVGNILMMDEGVGVHVVNQLEKEPLPPHVHLMDGGTAGFELIDMMEGYKKIFIIDAMDAAKPPGEIIFKKPEELYDRSEKEGRSLHGYGLLTVLKLAKSVGKDFDIHLIGIQPMRIERGLDLTKPLRNKLSEIITFVKSQAIGN